MESLESIGKKVKNTVGFMNQITTKQKNELLIYLSKKILENKEKILIANKIDVEKATKNHVKQSLVDRLLLNENRIQQMAESLLKVADLDDPIGETIEGKKLENGLEILKKRVPLGVIAIIYESRPNVTLDAFSLCFKTSNSVILRGGSDAINSNIAIVKIIKEALKALKIPEDVVYLIEDTARETSLALMKLNTYVDVLIPRGGAGLIKTVVENSTVPVIETGTGNCHIYVDENCDMEMALDIIDNAKTQRTGVCNACESLVIHNHILKDFIPRLIERLSKKHVEIRGDKKACQYSSQIKEAKEEDFGKEYLDLVISLKTVDSIEEAIAHINTYSTKHSESIITNNYENAIQFLNEVDSSCVYINSSTRFTDGGEFGFGAEIGISTQKLHARGPMGLKELTTYKYVIFGNGQIRR